jgi:mycofactocin precursor peptide peptidase
LADLRSPQVSGDLLVVPLGATEQHGPHLPLGTDTTIAVALASSLADAVISPAMAFGSSGEHAGFAGTLSIGHDALVTVLLELGRSCAFPRLLFVNAHGGNADAVRRAVEVLRYEGRDVRAWSPSWPGDAHAGRIETSLMLALAPGLVGAEREPGNTEPLAALMPRLRAEGVRAVSPNGVLGDPTGASAEEGRALLATAATELRDFVRGAFPTATVENPSRTRRGEGGVA